MFTNLINNRRGSNISLTNKYFNKNSKKIDYKEYDDGKLILKENKNDRIKLFIPNFDSGKYQEKHSNFLPISTHSKNVNPL